METVNILILSQPELLIHNKENQQKIKFRSYRIPSNFWVLQGCVKLLERSQTCALGWQQR